MPAVLQFSLLSYSAWQEPVPANPSSGVLHVFLLPQILLETGEIGRQANGAVMLTCGKTVSHSLQGKDMLLSDSAYTACSATVTNQGP